MTMADATPHTRATHAGSLERLLGELWRDKAGFTGVVLIVGMLLMAA